MHNQIPIYSADGRPLGYRTPEAADRLIANGYVKYGRKGHLKALYLQQEDGGNPIETHPRNGTRYSFPQRLDSGLRCWKLKRLDTKDDDGTRVNTRRIFFQVVLDCSEPRTTMGIGGT
jgi:hypothetical protein